jgi:hypothetical protein
MKLGESNSTHCLNGKCSAAKTQTKVQTKCLAGRSLWMKRQLQEADRFALRVFADCSRRACGNALGEHAEML